MSLLVTVRSLHHFVGIDRTNCVFSFCFFFFFSSSQIIGLASPPPYTSTSSFFAIFFLFILLMRRSSVEAGQVGAENVEHATTGKNESTVRHLGTAASVY